MSLESKSHTIQLSSSLYPIALQCGLEFSTQFCHLYFFGNRFGLRIRVRTSDRRCGAFGVSEVGPYKETTMLHFYLRGRNAQHDQTHGDRRQTDCFLILEFLKVQPYLLPFVDGEDWIAATSQVLEQYRWRSVSFGEPKRILSRSTRAGP